MYTRRLDAVDGADGAGKLAFERAQMIDVLDEARGAERVGFVENLVTDAAALGQAALGELHAQPRDLVLRHHDYGAIIAQFVGNGLAFQVLDDRGRILDAEVGVEGGHLRRGDAHNDEREEAEQRGCHRDHRHQPRSTQALQEGYETLHQLPLRFGSRSRLGNYCLWYGFYLVNEGYGPAGKFKTEKIGLAG